MTSCAAIPARTRFWGRDGNDTLWGDNGDFDRLYGEAGNDELDGGFGRYDYCSGGAGTDNVSGLGACESILGVP